MYEDVLLPTDGSDGMEQVAARAGDLASRYDATVHVLSVPDTRNRFESPSSGLAPDAWTDAEQERAEQAIDETVQHLPDVAVTRVVEAGVPHEEILSYATDAGIDVIVMGTHGRTGLDHYLIGSVAERVVRRATVPVITVRLDE